MRRIFVMLLTLCMLIGAACAEAEYVSVTELREQAEAMGRWSQTYEAHGRTIAVDVPVIVPEVERVPIVQISGVMGYEIPGKFGLPVKGTVGRSIVYEDANLIPYLNGTEASGEAPEIHCIDPEAEERLFFQIYYQHPFSKRMGNWWYASEYCYPHEIDTQTVFAEDNDLSLADAQNVLERLLERYYGDEFTDIDMDYIEVRGRARKKGSRRLDDLGSYKKDYPKGTYYLEFRQKFEGIPFYMIIEDKALTTGEGDFSGEVWPKWRGIEGKSSFEYMDDSSFWLNAYMAKQEGVAVEDVPLASLETVLGTLEKEIADGHLRSVFALRLGYVCYLDEGSPQTYSLYPMWMCDCLYTDSARKEMQIPEWSDEYREYFDYQQILIDAQTCEIVSGWIMSDDDFYHAEPVTWDDV